MDIIELAVTAVGTLVITGALVFYVSLVCRRNPALVANQPVLVLIVMLWISMVAVKLFYIDKVRPPIDAALHEEIARDIAYDFHQGDFRTAFSHCQPGNKGFRFGLGVFYALTSAPKGITYLINAALSLWGLIAILELICQNARPSRVPAWVVVVVCATPSALYWTTGILKEGPILWGIAMMLKLTAFYTGSARRGGLVLPLTGFALVASVRPHIAVAWMAGIWAGSAIRKGKTGIGILGILGMLCSLFVLQQLLPDTMSKFTEIGIVETLNDWYARRENIGGSSITYVGGKPTPILNGLLLILLRPYPTEVFSVESAVAGIEIWMLTALCVFSWLRLPSRSRVAMSPFIVTCLAALLLLSFFFSYSYNMGQMVRHRLQVLPALLALIATPALLATRIPKRSGRFSQTTVGLGHEGRASFR